MFVNRVVPSKRVRWLSGLSSLDAERGQLHFREGQGQHTRQVLSNSFSDVLSAHYLSPKSPKKREKARKPPSFDKAEALQLPYDLGTRSNFGGVDVEAAGYRDVDKEEAELQKKKEEQEERKRKRKAEMQEGKGKEKKKKAMN